MSKLLGNRVLIEQDKTEEKTLSGVYVVKSEEMDDYKRGIVIEIGEGKMNDNGDLLPMGVKKDDKIIFQYGKPIIIDGKSLVLVQEEDIIRIL